MNSRDEMDARARDERREDNAEDSTEFYESMPAAMDNRYVARNHDYDEADRSSRRSALPWLIIPLVLLLGLIIWGLWANSRPVQPTNTNTGEAPQQQTSY